VFFQVRIREHGLAERPTTLCNDPRDTSFAPRVPRQDPLPENPLAEFDSVLLSSSTIFFDQHIGTPRKCVNTAPHEVRKHDSVVSRRGRRSRRNRWRRTIGSIEQRCTSGRITGATRLNKLAGRFPVCYVKIIRRRWSPRPWPPLPGQFKRSMSTRVYAVPLVNVVRSICRIGTKRISFNGSIDVRDLFVSILATRLDHPARNRCGIYRKYARLASKPSGEATKLVMVFKQQHLMPRFSEHIGAREAA